MDKLDYEEYFGILMDKTNNMKKHPYYDGDRKKRTESAALKMIGIAIVGMLVLLILSTILKALG